MKEINWNKITIEGFWEIADDLQDETLKHAKDLFAYVEVADYKSLVSLLIQYRFFTIYYIPDIAILLSRMQDGPLRSFLAEILSDELGNSDPLKAHPRLYDDFLETLGLAREDLDSLAIMDNIEILENNRRNLIDPEKSSIYGIGLRGMGGECVCQIYLSQLYEHICKNPYIKENKAHINWKFWDLHIGDHDIEHREMTRRLIHSEIVAHGSDAMVDLGRGYNESMSSWQKFWDNILASVKTENMQQVLVSRRPNFKVLIQSNNVKNIDDMEKSIKQFHLAIPVHDLDQAKHFYCNILGASEGRSTYNHIDLNLYGHHLVIHIAPADQADLFSTFSSDFHGETVPVPHFGLNLDREAWSQLAERISSHQYNFFDPPHIRLEGHPGEHATMFVVDPSGNALEFKSFLNHDEVFEKVFNPNTKNLFGLEDMVSEAAAGAAV